ncbi:MAG: N-acetylmuramic acid 6-phosphate etherase, partial [Chloroflexi bacterium]|nr:N-acetylmuramic acid 6-phosphate etherase [Chloroflexota bacterium]
RAVRLVCAAARVDEATAESALRAADGRVKVAIAALRLGVGSAEADARLREADGHLRRVLGEA